MDDSSVDMSFGSALSGSESQPRDSLSPARALNFGSNNNKGRVSDAPFVSPPPYQLRAQAAASGGGGTGKRVSLAFSNASPAFTLSSHGALNKNELKNELTVAITRASARGLKQSAKWAAELLTGIPQESPQDRSANAQNAATPPPLEPGQTSPRYLLAKSYYDAGELMRCVSALSPPMVVPGKSALRDLTALELFLWGYALYLAGEKAKEEKMGEVKDPIEKQRVENVNLHVLDIALEEASSDGKSDGFLLYLHGVVQKAMGRSEDALRTFCEAARAYPLNWSMWLDVAALARPKTLWPSCSCPIIGLSHSFTGTRS